MSSPSKIIEEDIETLVQDLSGFKGVVKGKKVLVTGGAGFLGSWFCDVLVALEAEVFCVDTLIVTGESWANVQHLLGKENFHTFKKPEESGIEDWDYIVHMAAIASPPIYQKHPVETFFAGPIFTYNLLQEFLREGTHQVKGFLYTSTSEVYGNPEDASIPTPETYAGYVSSYGPRAMYDESKRATEALLFAWRMENPTAPIRIARIFNTYGPRLDIKSTSQYGRALIKFVHQTLTGQPITIYGGGQQTRSFCYVTDQVRGLFSLLLTPGIDGEVVNIGNDKETTILQLTQKIKELTGSTSPIVFDSPPIYNITDDPRRRCPDITKARQMLGYVPKVDLEEGLKRTIAWYREQLQRYN